MVALIGGCTIAMAVALTIAPCLPSGVGDVRRNREINRRFVVSIGVRRFPMSPLLMGTEPDANAIAEQFDWVHGLDRMRIAERLSGQRPHHAQPLNVCVQVNIAGESSKAGVAPAEALTLLHEVAALPRLRLRGLMGMLPFELPAPAQRQAFAALRLLREAANASGLALDTLSMGMSGDFEAAIAEGATIVRIGTALFGPRS